MLMSKKFIILLCLATTFIIGCTNNAQIKPLKPIHVATGDWEPYIGQNLPQNGIAAQMISSILIELNYIPIFKYYDWGFIHTHLDAGYPSFAFPYLKGSDSLKYKYSLPIVKLDYVLFFYDRTGNIKYNFNSLADIIKTNKRIGRIKGYTKLPELENDSLYVEVPSALDGFYMLINNEIDFLLEAKQTGEQLTKSDKIPIDSDHFSYLGKANPPNEKDDSVFVKNFSFRIKFSPKVSNDFIINVNKAIQKCTKLDYYKNLVEKVKNPQKEFIRAHLNNPNKTLIYGYSNIEKKQPDYVLPLSVEVVVLKWNKIFLSHISQKDKKFAKLRSQVKIINGPLKGKVLWIENDQLELSKK